ncbi:hypothetical protein I8751_23350 [Nostocaceae cyanobacterium CENA357]|uniref:Uncharacterized protein n=1 Tax=Atlanticothrix silvestris CENA357 TaxID=1725252 RepID=A0A8J7L3S4_9CYAN|nr:hypothetical protein [Atlanticothrix silvestris]MBH8555230.1 hypothetical protein [Atlanticothrix silvestris CENA357]
MTISNSLECRYLGWGDFHHFRQMPLAENEALIYTTPIGSVPILIHGFLNCIRSEELKEKLPQQFSENELVAVMVEMVRTLPDSLIQEFNNQKIFSDNIVVCGVISW